MEVPSPKTQTPVLVIADVFPDATDRNCWLTQIIRALSQSRALTLLARDGRGNRESAWRELGIQTLAGDNERLASLGVETPDFGSPLPRLLEQGNFAIALLAQDFSRGITIPEHYLDDIRRLSPHSKIAVLSEELHARVALRRAERSQQHHHYEVAQDCSEREWEGFERADLVVVSHAQDAALLFEREPLLPVTVVPHVAEHGPEAGDWNSRRGVVLPLDLSRRSDVDGFVKFIERGWPIIRQRAPEIELLIAGGEEVPLESRQKLEGVHWFPAGELDQLMTRTRLFLFPARLGESRSALLGMLASGLPGVASSATMEAAGLPPESGVLCADLAEECAHTAVRLHKNRKLWDALTKKGRIFIQQQHSPALQAERLAHALEQLATIVSKPVSPAQFSIMLVESAAPELIRQARGKQRTLLRVNLQMRLAGDLLRADKPAEARQQLRHIFSWLGESAQGEIALTQLLSLLGRCYRELGEEAMTQRCGNEARQYFLEQTATIAKPRSSASRANGAPEISLIVPTFDRLPILRKCLAAIESQTVSRRNLEVIVIDDGSSDGTENFLREYRPQFQFQYLRQKNSGTGAARRHGVEHATGEYLLLMNDDTICQPDVVEQHLRMQKKHAGERWAILGNFEYPREARRRAMTHFLHENSFMFPQVDMEDGFPYPYSHFITCNLSIRRDAVIDAGSFDPIYKLSEDTELGIRLFEMGYGVLYHPAAHAWHDHLPYTVANLIRRARVYGADYFYMFRRHPGTLRRWALPINLGTMDASAAGRLRSYVTENRSNVEAAARALSNWDAVDFEPILERPKDAAHILSLFQQAVPAIHWFYLLESMLETMSRELGISAGAANLRLVMTAAQGSAL